MGCTLRNPSDKQIVWYGWPELPIFSSASDGRMVAVTHLPARLRFDNILDEWLVGRFALTAPTHDHEVGRVWDAETGAALLELPVDCMQIVFSARRPAHGGTRPPRRPHQRLGPAAAPPEGEDCVDGGGVVGWFSALVRSWASLATLAWGVARASQLEKKPTFPMGLPRHPATTGRRTYSSAPAPRNDTTGCATNRVESPFPRPRSDGAGVHPRRLT